MHLPQSASFIRSEIAGLRRRLLDTTKKNPLISFKHSPRGARFIRIVDELPNQIYSRLDDGQLFRFKSLGEQSNEPEDEKSIVFRRALEAAKIEDEEYRQGIEALGDEPGERAVQQLEVGLRVRVREKLGMSKRKVATDASATFVAMSQGIKTEYDLPTAAAEKHTDTYLQTLLFDGDMERRLAQIRERVRLSMDETGVNPLFCVFGFLEWYEDANSSTPLHAPLLLCPLEIDRTLVRGHYQYTIKSTGEGATVNVALAERLKELDIQLPPYGVDESDTPEKYWTAVQKIIETQRNWKLRRWVTIGLFSFARIAMYHDLAPENWEAEGGIEQHAGLSRILAGTQADPQPESDPSAAIHPAEPSDFDVPLIADADSSQVAAIRDVLSGRDLVIEGPPGTGKSQTIMNIIAAALNAGKTVLFLAEKMAALNVVKNRLEGARLGDFCLEVHSNKASRRSVLESLNRRIDRLPAAKVDAELRSTLAELKQLQWQLDSRVEALAQGAGDLGITTQRLLWRCHKLRKQTEHLPQELDDLEFPGVNGLTQLDVSRLASLADQFERARSALVVAFGNIRNHPWHGVHVRDLDPIRAGDALRRMKDLANAAANVESVLGRVALLSGVQVENARTLETVVHASALPEWPSAACNQIVSRMSDPQVHATLSSLVEDISEHGRLCATVASHFSDEPAANECLPSDLTKLSRMSNDQGILGVVAGELPAIAEKRLREARAWSAVDALLTQASVLTGCSREPTTQSERALFVAIELAVSSDPEILANRTVSTIRAGASATLRRAMGTSEHLRTHRAALSERFALQAINDPQLLRRHAINLRAASGLPALYPSWWRARRLFRGLSVKPLKCGRLEMAAAFDELALYYDEAARFETDPEVESVLGSAANRGIDFNFEPLSQCAEWADRVRYRLPAVDATSAHLHRFLLEAPSSQVEALAAISRDPSFSSLRKVVSRPAEPAMMVAEHAATARRCSDTLSEIVSLTAKLVLRPGCPLDNCETIAAAISRRNELREGVNSSRLASSLLGDRFRGTATDTTEMRASADFVRSVGQSQLHPALKSWLLSSEASVRLASLRELATEARSALDGFHAAVERLTRVALIDFKTWIHAESPSDAHTAQLQVHAQRCAAGEEDLQLLIDDARLRTEIQEAGLEPLVVLLERHQSPLRSLGDATRRVIYHTLARYRIAESQALIGFSGDRQNTDRGQFAKLDRRLQNLRQSQIAASVAGRPCDSGVGTGPRKDWTGRALIDNERSKLKRHISIRDLLDRSGRAIQQLMPCFMMSPLSVAQFLKPGGIKFDIIVMDEASQMRPEDAVGAIARGRQVVIVGDPKQLPPTNFFMGAESDAADETEESAVEGESILDQALTVLRPARRLKWHYRSRHGSLIAFSNKEFYDGELVVFPSPHHDDNEYGVSFRPIPDGRYRSSVNPIEAQRVAEATLEYVKNHPDRSLGVVTLNQPQAELTSIEIDRLAASDGEFEAWRRKQDSSLEPFFVKNLENVQGDERDTIFISTVYGRDEQGAFFQRFGPINNRSYGHRRLNVLFTRSKCQTIVFSSMDPADIHADASSAWGLRALKAYMQFAINGQLELPRETDREPDSEFEIGVAEVLRANGCNVLPQVGVAGYFIDIAVRHPDHPGAFVLGIECDGATYHSSKSARDRDRLRQEVLERLNWRIHRIWSLDWFRSPARETQRLLNAVNEATAGWNERRL